MVLGRRSNTFNDFNDPGALLNVPKKKPPSDGCYTIGTVSNNQAIPCITALSKNNEQRVPDRA